MEETTKTKRSLILTAIICSVYLLLTIFYHHIDKYISGIVCWVLTALIPITFITMIVFEIKGFIRLIRNRKSWTLKLCLPTIICSITLLYTLFSPYRLDSEKLESEVEFRACYEGTQNQAYILFRKDKTFELHWTGVFGYNKWWTGKWERKGNVLDHPDHGQNGTDRRLNRSDTRQRQLVAVENDVDGCRNDFDR